MTHSFHLLARWSTSTLVMKDVAFLTVNMSELSEPRNYIIIIFVENACIYSNLLRHKFGQCT